MIPDPARYLLRFDDLCPTMDRRRWERFLPLIERFSIRPILAIVPDNHDPDLDRAPADPAFWAHLRDLQAAGATIGLHGFRHRCRVRGKSLIPLHRNSEFAGIPRLLQQEWIRIGIRILRGHGLNPRIWVAPRHGFDRNTLAALGAEGIGLVSDGFARSAFLRNNLVWIPQQLWEPAFKSAGLWTICIHPNTAPDSYVENLGNFLAESSGQFTSIDQIAAEFPASPLSWRERYYEQRAILRLRTGKFLRLLR